MKMKGMKIIGSRPDLLAFTNNSTFAIEAKGYSRSSVNNMTNHKNQSRMGGIPVNFTVASVSYDLYSQVKCKYHDPYNNAIKFDDELFSNLTKEYYRGLMDFLTFGEYKEVKFKKEEFYEIDLFSPYFRDMYDSDFFRYQMLDLFHHNQLKIILPKKIEEYAKDGLNSDVKPFLFDGEKRVYIDNDRIGLKFR